MRRHSALARGHIRGSCTYPEFKSAHAQELVLMLPLCLLKRGVPVLPLIVPVRSYIYALLKSLCGLSRAGCCNKRAQTGWLMKTEMYRILTVTEAASLRSGCQQGLVMALFWVEDFCLYPQLAERAREVCGASLVRT